MQKIKSSVKILVVLAILASAGYISVRYYHIIFARIVVGKVEAVERLTNPVVITGAGAAETPREQLFSFTVAIRDKTGEIVTSSSEDRRWAVVKPGQCAKARFFPYPFWRFDKQGLYFGVHLIELFDCP